MRRTRTSLDLSATATVKKKQPPFIWGTAVSAHLIALRRASLGCKTRGHGAQARAFAHPTVTLLPVRELPDHN